MNEWNSPLPSVHRSLARKSTPTSHFVSHPQFLKTQSKSSTSHTLVHRSMSLVGGTSTTFPCHQAHPHTFRNFLHIPKKEYNTSSTSSKNNGTSIHICKIFHLCAIQSAESQRFPSSMMTMMISIQQPSSVALRHYHGLILLWLFSYMVLLRSTSIISGFIIPDAMRTTTRTAFVVTSPSRTVSIHPEVPKQRGNTQLFYSNSNDWTNYQQQQQQQAQAQPLPGDNDSLLSKALIGTATVSRATTKATTATTITILEDFYNVIQECRQQNTLLLVHWSAPWCRSCQRIAPLLHRTIHQVATTTRTSSSSSSTTTTIASTATPKLRYVNIPLLYSLSTLSHYSRDHPNQQQPQQQQQRTNLHAMFDIRTVPYCHVYHPTDGLVDEFTITTSSATSSKPQQRKRNHNTATKTISEIQQLLESFITTGTGTTTTSIHPTN